MEEFGLIIILIFATFYVLRHVKRTLTVGESDKGCQNCPAVKKLTTKKQSGHKVHKVL